MSSTKLPLLYFMPLMGGIRHRRRPLHISIFIVSAVLPPSRNIRSWRVQTQETTVRGNDFYTPHFTLPTNSPPTHQPHSIFSYPFRTLYFGTKFEPSRTLYFGTEGVVSVDGIISHIMHPIYTHSVFHDDIIDVLVA
jgi:hypothetical protein